MKQIKLCFKDFMRAALVRVVRTVAQTAAATIGVAAAI